MNASLHKHLNIRLTVRRDDRSNVECIICIALNLLVALISDAFGPCSFLNEASMNREKLQRKTSQHSQHMNYCSVILQ